MNGTSWILIFKRKIVFTFKKNNLQLIRLTSNSILNCQNPKGTALVTRLRTSLAHFCEHKFQHSFQDSLNPICRCDNHVQSCLHFFYTFSYSKMKEVSSWAMLKILTATFFKIRINSMQGWTVITENLLRKNLQLKGVC